MQRQEDAGYSWGHLAPEWRQVMARSWKALNHVVSYLDLIQWVMGAIVNLKNFFLQSFKFL